MKYSDIFVPAKDVCRFGASYQHAVAHFRQFGVRSKVNLAVAYMPEGMEIVWYSYDRKSRRILMTPAFKRSHPLDFDFLEPSSISRIKGGTLIVRDFHLYIFDAICINRIKCLWSQDLMKIYAQFQGMSDECEFRLVKAYSVGKTREFVAVEWVADDPINETELYYPVFEDDLRKFKKSNGDCLGPMEFCYDSLEVGETFIKNGKLWEVCQSPEFHSLFIREKAPHLKLSVCS